MYFIYSLLLCLGFTILLPRFLLDALRHGKYVAGFRERLGSVTPLSNKNQPVVWLHCVSVGETQAARPLIKALKDHFPNHLIAISTITVTGQNLAREAFGKAAAKVFYFPFDWRWTVRRAMKAINPDLVLVMETELWPNFLRECAAQQIPVALVNGRLSHQSFRRYKIIKGFMTRVLGSLQVAAMQTEADAERIRALGMKPDRTLVLGSLKFDAGTMPTNETLTKEFQRRFGLSDQSPLILAASTHAPEEKVVLEAFKQIVAQSTAAARLMIVPRHPERFEEVAKLIETSGFRWSQKSKSPSPSDTEAEIILLDTIGELPSVYSFATVVFVGGSIAQTGGHNILEPAAVGAAIITGPHTHNFQAIVESFVTTGAIVQLPELADSEMAPTLGREISNLLNDAVRRQELGERASQLVNENRGATERIINSLKPLMAVSDHTVEHTDLQPIKSAPLA